MATPIRTGILMGGGAREREISFAGGRTVYDNLDKALFAPVPIFLDSYGTPVRLDWPYLYKGTIRDFFPPADALPDLPFPAQLYLEHLGPLRDDAYDRILHSVGRRMTWADVRAEVDFAFLTLHGALGEDGAMQGLLEVLGLPYSGCGIAGSALGMDKLALRRWLPGLGFAAPRWTALRVADWAADPAAETARVAAQVGFPCVVKHPTQGSSIGVHIVPDAGALADAVGKAAFRKRITRAEWQGLSPESRIAFVQSLTDLREALCLPLQLVPDQGDPVVLYRPDRLLDILDHLTVDAELLAPDAPDALLVEAFVDGTEFSVIVIEDAAGKPLALPPTQIVKGQALYDYRSKYLPGLARKITPIELPDEEVRHICAEAERLMAALGFNVYARIDGILERGSGTVFFNDPNTTSGMLPGSFFFHQASEIGLNPSQFLTYVVQASLGARQREGKLRLAAQRLERQLAASLAAKASEASQRMRVGVFLGGYSTERHVAVESGRNVYEKLSSTPAYAPLPVFVLHNNRLAPEQRQQLGIGGELPFSFWALPVNYLLKDNADDIADRIVASVLATAHHPVVADIRTRAAGITERFAASALTQPQHLPAQQLGEHMDFAFVTVHGRPGEDGQMQALLEQIGVPYNGSGVASSQLTIQKYATNERLAANGLHIPAHRLLAKADYLRNPEAALAALEARLPYPLIAKPADEGCSSAVKRIRSREEMAAYAQATFRGGDEAVPAAAAATLGLGPREEFPAKDEVLLEELVAAGPGERVLEVTVGLMTQTQTDGSLQYHVFEPSETLASGAILSLEEKFLAGEGQNITPARFHPQVSEQARISAAVREQVGRAAQLLGVAGYARIDAFVRLRGTPAEVDVVFIELNSLPAMTPATVIFHQAALAGYSPVQFMEALIAEGLRRAGREPAAVSGPGSA